MPGAGLLGLGASSGVGGLVGALLGLAGRRQVGGLPQTITDSDSPGGQSTVGSFGPSTSSASTMVYAYPCSARNRCRCAAYSVSIVSRDTTV